MALWRYKAIPARATGEPGATQRIGELTADSAAAVRASLRRIGLQAVEVKPIGQRPWLLRVPAELKAVEQTFHRHLRARRRLQRAEIYDSLATMLGSGLPLLEAIETLIQSSQRGGRSSRLMLSNVREQLRSGGSLAQAMRERPSWFDAAEVAIVDAGQHGGNLNQVLSSLADRHERAGELGQKLISALAYPFVVLLVGCAVAIFLSVKTLPQLSKILQDAGVPVPGLTTKVIWAGGALVKYWLVLALMIVAGAVAIPLTTKLAYRMPWDLSSKMKSLRWMRPRVIRTVAVGGVAVRLAELMRSGVPMVDSLRIIAPTTRHRSLRQELSTAADCVERGDDLSHALSDEHWFDPEFQRLLDIGQASGELESMLQRIGERYQRQARRLIDRLAALLEPVVILALATFVGLVVMAAILPLLRLQEIL